MFRWATEQFDKISQAVAPPPSDAAGRFAFAVQRLEEETAMGCIAEIDPLSTIVNPGRGLFPIHLACQYSMMRLIQLLMQQPGMNIEQPDYGGNTPLHHACTSSQRINALAVVKLLINDYGASVLAKNSQGQTPYDVAKLDSIRQYVLPIQLQKETQIALDNGGLGLPPGIDLGGLRITNPLMPPPPKFGEGLSGPPTGAAENGSTDSGMMATPNEQRYAFTTNYAASSSLAPAPSYQAQIPPQSTVAVTSPVAPAPVSMPNTRATATTTPATSSTLNRSIASTSTGSVASSENGYSRSGGSSAAIFSKYRADGFHSSSSDLALQKKYGHVSTTGNMIMPPPPSSGNAAPLRGGVPEHTVAAPAVPGANPFGGGYRPGSRYVDVAYGPTAASPAPASSPCYGPYAPASTAPAPQYFTPQVNVSVPAHAAASTSAITKLTSPASAVAPTTPYMPPPPYQSRNFDSPASTLVPAATAQTVTCGQPATMSMSTPTATSSEPVAFATPQPATPADTASDIFDKPPEPKTISSSFENVQSSVEATTVAAVTEDAQTKEESVSSNRNDWVETVDPSSGQTYYYNTNTNETSWTMPALTSSRITDTSTPTTGTKIERDWTEVTDPSSGLVYYYNKTTGETSWEKPDEVKSTTADDAVEDSMDTDAAVETNRHETDPASTTDEPINARKEDEKEDNKDFVVKESPKITGDSSSEPEVKKSSATGESEYGIQSANTTPDENMDTKENLEENSRVEAPKEEKMLEVVSDDVQEVEQNDAAEGDLDAWLPADWVEVQDPTSGKSYYYNQKTQETSWDRPATSSGIETKTSVERTSFDSVAPGWAEVTDPSSGRNYYFNQITNETRWEKPLVTSDESSYSATDWVKASDQASGRLYFYNTKTGETAWEMPVGVASADQAPDAVHADHSAKADSDQDRMTKENGKYLTTPQPSVTEGIKSALFLERTHDEIETNVSSSETAPAAEQNFVSPAASTFESPAAPAKIIESESGSNLFGPPPIESQSSNTMTSESVVEDSSIEQVAADPVDPPQDSEKFKLTNVHDSDELDDESDMMEIPLSPEPVARVAPEASNEADTVPLADASASLVKSSDQTAVAARNSVAPTVANATDLFAAIGMPPPPFQSKRQLNL